MIRAAVSRCEVVTGRGRRHGGGQPPPDPELHRDRLAAGIGIERPSRHRYRCGRLDRPHRQPVGHRPARAGEEGERLAIGSCDPGRCSGAGQGERIASDLTCQGRQSAERPRQVVGRGQRDAVQRDRHPVAGEAQVRDVEARGHLTIEGDRDRIEGTGPRIARAESRFGREGLCRERCQGRGGVEPAAGHRLAGEAGERIDRAEDGRTDLCDGDAGLRGGQQGDNARHLGGGLRGARHAAVGAVGTGGVDPHAGSAEVDGRGTVVGEAGEHVIPVGGGDGDHVGQIEAGGIAGAHVAVGGAVARCGDERDAHIAVRSDGVLEHRRCSGAAAPTVVGDDDVDAVIPPHHRGVVERGDGPAGVADAVVVLEPQRHDGDLPVDPRDAQPVVADGADDARHVSAVAVAVLDVVVVLDEVPAVDVVYEAVVVVVDAVAGNFAGVGPDVGCQIRVRKVDSGVDHADHDAPRSGGDIPGLRRMDVGADHAVAVDGGVVEAPLRREARIIRERR